MLGLMHAACILDAVQRLLMSSMYPRSCTNLAANLPLALSWELCKKHVLQTHDMTGIEL